MRRLRLPAAFLFLLLSLQVVIPAQIWHELVDHHDTHECQAPDAITSVSDRHTHCLVLELTLPGMLSEEHRFDFSISEIEFNYHASSVPAVVFIPYELISVRGPPAADFSC